MGLRNFCTLEVEEKVLIIFFQASILSFLPRITGISEAYKSLLAI